MSNEPSAGEPGEHSDEEVDRRFEEITAGWDTEFGNDDARPDDPGADASADPAPETPQPFSVPAQWRAGTGESILDSTYGDFVPPEPEPLPKDEMFWVTLGCLLGGPAWLLYLLLFDRYTSALWWVLALATFFAGIILLVVRQPANRDEDDPFDDGARI